MNNSDIKLKLNKLKTKKLTCEQNVSYFLSNIEKNNKKYNIFLEINKKGEEKAKKLDAKLKKGEK